MNRKQLILAAALACTALLAPPLAFAADPGGGSSGGGSDNLLPTGNPAGDQGNTVHQTQLQGLAIQGKVVDGGGAPLGGVRVKLFAAGILAGHARTASDGTFTLEGNPMRGERITTDIWFESPDPAKYVDVNVVLTAAQNGLFPDCTPRITPRDGSAVIEVTMRSAEQLREELKRSDCLEGGAVQGPAAP